MPGLVAVQPAVEGFLRVAGVAAFHQQPRQVQARGCGAASRRWRRARGPAVARVSRAARRFPLGAPGAAASTASRCALQPGVRLVDLQPDDVNSLAAPVGRELDTGHEADAGGCAGGARLGQTRGGVVIGERERADAARRARAPPARPAPARHRRNGCACGNRRGFRGWHPSGVRMIRPACHRNPHSAAGLVGHRHRAARSRRHAARPGLRQPHLARPRAAAVRRGARAWTCTPPMRKSRGASRERSGTLDWYCIEYWSRTLGIDIGALHREVRSHVAWLPGARDFLARMRAAGKRLVLLTNSHPDRARGETRADRRARLSRRRRHVPRIRRAQGTCAVLASGASRASASTRRAACSPTTIRGCSRRRAAPASAGCTACGTGTRRGSRREHLDHPRGCVADL